MRRSQALNQFLGGTRLEQFGAVICLLEDEQTVGFILLLLLIGLRQERAIIKSFDAGLSQSVDFFTSYKELRLQRLDVVRLGI